MNNIHRIKYLSVCTRWSNFQDFFSQTVCFPQGLKNTAIPSVEKKFTILLVLLFFDILTNLLFND